MQDHAKYTVAETLYERDGTALYRAICSVDHAPVILKVLDPARMGPRALEHQRHEYELGHSLHLRGVVRPLALDTHRGMPALVLEDFGGQPLDRAFPGPIATEPFLELAVRIAEDVADLHRDGVVHKDLKPENILVDPARTVTPS